MFSLSGMNIGRRHGRRYVKQEAIACDRANRLELATNIKREELE